MEFTNRFRINSNQIINKVLLIILSSTLFFLSHPNFIIKNGCSFLSLLFFIPIIFIIKNSTLKSSVIYGVVFGVLSYFLYAFWLFKYSFIAMIFCLIIISIKFALVFFVLAWINKKYTQYGILFYPIIWVCAEYVFSKGFFGINYGIIGYSFWKFPILIQSAKIYGVWIISFVCICFSCFIYFLISNKQITRIFPITSLVIICVLNIFVNYQNMNKERLENNEIKIALIQNNIDPWKPISKTLNTEITDLIMLSQSAKNQMNDLDLVVWPETAIVPRITYNYEKANNINYYNSVKKVLNFINELKIPVLLGNDHCIELENGSKKDYNAALLFYPNENVIPPRPLVYSKIHLVPITEKLPFKNKEIVNYLENKFDLNLWNEGNEITLFDIKNSLFVTPICFEDTFGNDVRKMIKEGGQFIVNLSNDSWAKDLSCQKQHLSMAIFRSIENDVYSARSTASGETVIIDNKGNIVNYCESFTKGFITGVIYPKDKEYFTFYTKYGDFLPLIFILFLALLLIAPNIQKMINLNKRKEYI